MNMEQLTSKISQYDLVMFTKLLAVFIQNGIPLYEALLFVSNGETNYSKLAKLLAQKVRQGVVFYKALSEFPHIFDHLYIGIAQAGEASGKLAVALYDLGCFLDKQRKFQNKLMAMLAYPMFILGLSIVLFLGLMLLFVPSIKDVLLDIQSVDKLNYLTLIVFGCSDFMVNNMLLLGVLLISVIIGAYIFYNIWISYVIRVPIINKLVIKINIYVLFYIMLLATSSGVSLLKSLKLAYSAVWHPAISCWISDAIKSVLNGGMVSHAMSSAIPPYIYSMIKTGEITGNIESACNSIVRAIEEDVDSSLNVVLGVIQPGMLIIVGIMVGAIILGVFLPITSVSLI